MRKIVLKDNIYNEDEFSSKVYSFNNITKLKDKEYMTVLNGEELAELWLDEKLVYYPQTQRGVKLVKQRVTGKRKKPEIKEVAVYNNKNVQEIRSLIVRGKYYPDQITLNLLSNVDNEIEYNEETSELTMSGMLCILDGQHRIKALSLVKQENDLLGVKNQANIKDLKFPVKITNYDEEEAQFQFYQFTKGMAISKSKAESFNKENAVNRIVNELNFEGILKDRIDVNNTTVSKNDKKHITTFSTMVSAIKMSYGEIKNEKEEAEILSFLKYFFKELFKIYPEILDFEERNTSNRYNLICENFTMYGYIEISKFLYPLRDKKWIPTLEKVQDINFNKYDDNGEINPLWEEILRPAKNGVTIINNASTRALFRNKIREQMILKMY